jgi:hypothetical protein
MSKKTFADICIDRSERATDGPWEAISDLPSWAVASLSAQTDVVSTVNRKYRVPYRTNLGCDINDADFIAQARTDVPELARRLQKAINKLREVDMELSAGNYYVEHDGSHRRLADELEAIPGEE